MLLVYFFKEEAADEMRISEWSSGVCSSDVRKGIVQHLFETPSLCPRRRRLLSLDAIETSEQAATEKRAPGRILEPSKVRAGHLDIDLLRSAERRGGKECVSTGRHRWSRYNEKKKDQHQRTTS